MDFLSEHPKLRGAIAGMNTAVVGILTAVFFTPIVSDTITGVADAIFAVAFVILLINWRMKPFTIVLLGIIIGGIWY